MASPGGASKRAKLMSPCESDQLKDKTAEVARKIQEAKARRALSPGPEGQGRGPACGISQEAISAHECRIGGRNEAGT